MNAAATAIITTKSPYMVRTSLTIPQLNETFAAGAYKSGVRQAYTMVSDYGPGHDASRRSQTGFKDGGRGSCRAVRFPVAKPGFFRLSCSVPRTLNPQGILRVSFPGARSRRRSARHSPSAASTAANEDLRAGRTGRRRGEKGHGRCGAGHRYGVSQRTGITSQR